MIHVLTPTIYVACLAAYNSGLLHGKWIDATLDCEDINEEISAMLADSPIPDAEEWAIHDYQGFAGICISQHDTVVETNRLAQLVAEHGEAFAYFATYVGNDMATEEHFQKAYLGCWPDETAFAQELFDELYELPTPISYYIDYDSFARDIFINDYFSEWATGSTGVHVFRNI